ncbi:MAG: hypothetical protein HY904_09275 [Deltaproteobacteria bacterium]|nr:hypothetical protein [Deltaproteobacteria bacterium]
MGKDARVAALLLVPLLAAWAFSWGRLAAYPLHVPADGDYAAARAVVERSGFQSTQDAWAVLPPWSLRAWQAMGDLRLISGDGLARRPLHRYARLFVVVEPDAEPHLEPLVARLGPPVERVEAGRLGVWRWDLGGPRVAYDFTARVAEAAVRIVNAAGTLVECNQPARGGVSCAGRGGWQRVTRQWLLVTENGDEALWAHPPPPGQAVEIAYDGVTLGPSIVVRAGHTRDGADRATGEVRLRVLVDGVEVGVVRRVPRFDFVPEEMDTRALAGAPHRVVFRIETDRDANNHFAFDAYAVADGSTP